MEKRFRNFITLSSLILILISVLGVYKIFLNAQASEPLIRFFVIKNPEKTWDDYTETDLQEIGCRASESNNRDFPRISDLIDADTFLSFYNWFKETNCFTRPLGALNKMFYVLRVRQDYPYVTIWNRETEESENFDIRTVPGAQRKGNYYEIGGPLNDEALRGLYEFTVANSSPGPSAERLSFYLATKDLSEFNASLLNFAGFIFYKNGELSTSKENVQSPYTANFTYFSSPSFCSEDYTGNLKDTLNRLSIRPTDPISLTNPPVNFPKTLFSSQNVTTSLYLIESNSRRQITPGILLSILGGGRNIGVSDLVVNYGRPVCLGSTTTLIAQVTNYANDSCSSGRLTLSVNGSSNTQNLGTLEAFSSKNYSMNWSPTATGTYTFQASLSDLGDCDRYIDDNSMATNVYVYDQESCPTPTNYFCHVGFCYLCPGGVLPPSRSCELRPNSECEAHNVPCKAKIKE
mgnify:CR=1 FL=1